MGQTSPRPVLVVQWSTRFLCPTIQPFLFWRDIFFRKPHQTSNRHILCTRDVKFSLCFNHSAVALKLSPPSTSTMLTVNPCFFLISWNYCIHFLKKDHTEDTSLIHRSQPLPPMQKNSNWFDKFLTSLAGKSFPSTKKVKQPTPANWDRRTNTSTLWFPLMHTSTSFWQGLRLLSNSHTSFFIPNAVDSCRRITVFFRLNFHHMYIKSHI